MLLLIRPYTLSATSSQCIAAAHGSSIPNCKDSAEEDMMCSVILMNMLLVHETHDVGYTVDTRRRSLTAIMISIAMQAVQLDLLVIVSTSCHRLKQPFLALC